MKANGRLSRGYRTCCSLTLAILVGVPLARADILDHWTIVTSLMGVMVMRGQLYPQKTGEVGRGVILQTNIVPIRCLLPGRWFMREAVSLPWVASGLSAFPRTELIGP